MKSDKVNGSRACRATSRRCLWPGRRSSLLSTERVGSGSAINSRTSPKSPTTCASVNSMYTEAINHGPGVTFMQTGSQFPGRPTMGAWLDYGLGSDNANLPAFVVMTTKGAGGQPLVARYWGKRVSPVEASGRTIPCGQRSRPVPRES